MENIIIVGGGLSGLSCAYELLKKGETNITIIEKRDRIGGRILTNTVNNLPYDLGGFIILPWYKKIFQYCKEFNITDQLKPFSNFKEYFYDIEIKKFIDLSTKKTPLIELLKLGFSILPLYMKGKLNFYNNYYTDDSFLNENAEEFLNKILGPKSTIKYFNNLIFQSYTYPPLNKISKLIYLKFILKMSLGYFNKAFILENGASTLINKMYETLNSNGIKFYLNKEVVDIKKNTIKTIDNKELEGDKIIIATTLEENIFNNILKTNYHFEYTNNYSIFVEMQNPLILNIREDDKWSFAYLPQFKNNNIVALYNPRSADKKHLNNTMEIILKVNNLNKRTFTFEELNEFLNNNIEIILPKNKIKRILTYVHWEKTMPIITPDLLKKLTDFQGKDNIFFTGDYWGPSTMESAINSAKEVTKHIS